MAYTPENNPYVPGDPYSYDLKWIVEKMKTYEEPQKYADAAAASAEESAASAAASKASQTAAAASANSSAASAAESELSAQRSAESAGSISGTESALNTRMDALSARMDSFEQLDPGSTTGDAELIDGRIGWTGKTYNTIGDAIRTQISEVNTELIDHNSRNLMPLFATYANTTTNGVSFTWSGGICVINGTATANTIMNFWTRDDGIPAYFEKNKTYYAKYKQGGKAYNRVRLSINMFTGTTLVKSYNFYDNFRFEIPSEIDGITMRLYVTNGASFSNFPVEIEIFSAPEQLALANADYNMPVFEMYSDFDITPGFYTAMAAITASALYSHTEKLKVRGGIKYYFTDAFISNSPLGVWYDKFGYIINTFNTSELEIENYLLPDATGTFDQGQYLVIYSLTAPEDAAYIAINYYNDRYRTSICSKPIYWAKGCGNLVLSVNDPRLSFTKNRKMCVIGTSNVMTDRLARHGYFGPEYPDNTQYVTGFQEYIMPYYEAVDTYGYSNTSFISGDDPSIVEQIRTKDLSGYDDFYIACTALGATLNNIGTLTGPEDLGDVTTYSGAIRQLIDYIYSQNPNAVIYLQSRYTRPQLSNASSFAIQTAVNEATKNICDMLHLKYIDGALSFGINYYNAPYLCYDTLGHLNHAGNAITGQHAIKEILGL